VLERKKGDKKRRKRIEKIKQKKPHASMPQGLETASFQDARTLGQPKLKLS
jgi:hypothetical protein